MQGKCLRAETVLTLTMKRQSSVSRGSICLSFSALSIKQKFNYKTAATRHEYHLTLYNIKLIFLYS